MYYDNKSSFYLRQYGPTVLILIVSFVLIGSGLYIYFTSNKAQNPSSDEVIVSSNNLKDDTQKVDNVLNTEKVKENLAPIELPKSFNDIDKLAKTDYVTVENVNDSNRLVINYQNVKLEVALIGIDTSKSVSTLNEDIKNAIIDNKVKLAFDNKRCDELYAYAYVYIDDNTMLNELLLESGKAKLRNEEENNSLNDVLTEAQAYAKQLKNGIWAN